MCVELVANHYSQQHVNKMSHLVSETRKKAPLMPKSRQKENIKMDFKGNKSGLNSTGLG
jgi:hypothetical protein